jgi:hypothetical protein
MSLLAPSLAKVISSWVWRTARRLWFPPASNPAPSIAGANAVLTRTPDTAAGYPSANYAIFSGISGSNKTITCNIPLFGGIAGFQIVPEIDPLPGAAISIQLVGGGTRVNLSWPANLGIFVLQESSDLLNWAPVNPQPILNAVAISVGASNQFFRLSRP